MDSKWIESVGLFVAGGIVTYLTTNIIIPKLRGAKSTAGHCNLTIKKDTAKVVDVLDVEDLGEKVSFCRCWKSAKFPYCDGAHNAHNKATGDNVGPLVISKKSN